MFGHSLGWAWTGAARVDGTFVIALLGQSNMVGRARFDKGPAHPRGTLQLGRTPPDDGVPVPATVPLDHRNENSGDMGLDVGFAQAWAAQNPGAVLVLAPEAEGSTALGTGHWQKGGACYDAAVARLNGLFAANPDVMLAGFLWHQGESDAGNPQYAAQLDRTIADLRADVTAAGPETPFVLGQLAAPWVAGGADRQAVQDIISDTPARLAHTAVVSSAGLAVLPDGVHFDAASLRTLGARYASALPQAMAGTAQPLTGPVAPVAVGTIPDQTDPVEDTGGAQTGLRPDAPDRPRGHSRPNRPGDCPGPAGSAGHHSGSARRGFPMTLPLDTAPFFAGEELTFAATGLPPGLAIDPASGVIAGAPTTEGTHPVAVTATNSAGQAGQSFTWTIVSAAGGGALAAEPGAAGHWVFGADYPGMTDLVAGQAMSELIPGAASLTDNAVVISDGDGTLAQARRGLVSGLAQRAEQTVCAVVSATSGVNRILIGNLSTTDGAGLFTFGADLFGNARGLPFNNTNFDPGTPTGAPFVFVAMSLSASQDWVLFRGDASGAVTASGAPMGAPVPIAARLGIGNTNYRSESFSAGGSWAEFIVLDGHRDAIEIESIYQRSRARLAERGVTLL